MSVLATLRNPSTLVCASPAREAAGTDEPVTVALNGQCFEGGAAEATFRFLPPLVPNGSFPSSGAVTGGAAVRVLGAGMLEGDARCLFGDAEVAAAWLPLERFEAEGHARRGSEAEPARTLAVHAGYVAANQTSVLGCIAPSAQVAGATALLVRNFDHAFDEWGESAHMADASHAAALAARRVCDDALDPGGLDNRVPRCVEEPPPPGEVRVSGDGDELRGDALVADGTLELCRAMTNFSGGSRGTLIIDRKHSAPRAIVRSFELAFEFQACRAPLPLSPAPPSPPSPHGPQRCHPHPPRRQAAARLPARPTASASPLGGCLRAESPLARLARAAASACACSSAPRAPAVTGVCGGTATSGCRRCASRLRTRRAACGRHLHGMCMACARQVG